MTLPRRAATFVVMVALIFGGLFDAGCGDDTFAVQVQVVSGIVPEGQFASVRTELLVGGGLDDTRGESLVQLSTVEARREQDFAHGHQVARFSNVGAGSYTVQVQLLKADQRLVLRRRAVIDVTGDRVVTVHMTPNCVGMACPSPGGGAGFSECIDGHCVDPRCNPPSPEFCEGLDFCRGESDCGPVAPCAEETCIDGVCNSASRADMCEAPLFCNSLSSEDPGCEPYPTVDAGVPEDADVMDSAVLDEGLPDAGVDMGTDALLNCGSLCIDAENPCLFGSIDCSSGSEVCNATIERLGVPCGDGRVCGAGGACVECVQNAECQSGCSVGHLECGVGAPVCVLGSGPSPVDAGVVCDALCAGGSVCPGVHVCSPSAECVACDDGASCTDGCQYGHISCAAGGICVVEGNFPPLTSCGGLDICDEHGVCEECVYDAPCQTPSECASGTLTNCGTPYVSCQYNSFKEPGAPCYESSEGVCSGDGRCYEPYRALAVTNLQGQTTCAIRADRLAECWGYSVLSGSSASWRTKRIVVGVDDVQIISLGSGYACFLDGSGDVYCAGSNYMGQLGDGTFEGREDARLVDLPAPAVDIVTMNYGACAALDDGSVYCWGSLGTTIPRITLPFPEQVAGITNAVQLAASAEADFPATCALLDDGRVSCWGFPRYGVLGDGVPWDASSPYVATPTFVVGISDAVSISMNFTSVCAVHATGLVSCWGGQPGALGDLGSSTIDYSPTPVPANQLAFGDVIAMSSNSYGRCVLRENGEVWCLSATGGALGRGLDTSVPNYISAPVVGVHDAVGLARQGLCLRRESGDILCWGWNNSGDELGVDRPDSLVIAPTAVMGGAS